MGSNTARGLKPRYSVPRVSPLGRPFTQGIETHVPTKANPDRHAPIVNSYGLGERATAYKVSSPRVTQRGIAPGRPNTDVRCPRGPPPLVTEQILFLCLSPPLPYNLS